MTAGPSFWSVLGNRFKLIASTVTSAGAGDANKLIATGADGKIDASLLTQAFDPVSLTAGVSIAANQLVNFYDNAGTPSMRLADSSLDREANGFVTAAVASGNVGTAYRGGPLTLSGMTTGVVYYLSNTTPGGVLAETSIVLVTGQCRQIIGVADSATDLMYQYRRSDLIG